MILVIPKSDPWDEAVDAVRAITAPAGVSTSRTPPRIVVIGPPDDVRDALTTLAAERGWTVETP